MAIVKMKKLTLFGLKSERDDILRDLAFSGDVEIREASFAAPLKKDADERLLELDEQLSLLKSAVGILSPLAPKTGLFAQKPSKTRADFEAELAGPKGALSFAEQAQALIEKKKAIASERSRLSLLIAALEPWKSLSLFLSFEGTKSTGAALFTVSASKKKQSLEEALFNALPEAALSQVFENKKQAGYLLIYHLSGKTAALSALKELGAEPAVFKGLSGTPAEELSRLNEEIAKLSESETEIDDKLKALAGNLPRIRFLLDALTGERDTLAEKAKLRLTESTFTATGFVPEKKLSALADTLSKYTVHIETKDADPEEDDVPVMLENKGIVAPYEMITGMYSLPKYGELDPNTIMAPFFWLLFGMMLSDFAYGLILTAAGIFASKKLKLSGALKSISGLMTQCGISTMIFGFLYGSFFGDAIPRAAFVFLGREVTVNAIFDPMKDPLTMLIVCVIIGFVHVAVGMAAQAWQLIKEGKIWSAVFDIGFWYVVFAGIIMLALGAGSGLYVMLAGAVGLVLTQGRDKKNIFLKFFSGLLSLYSITGFFSDLLSYSRVFALGLSTAVVAQVFNNIGSLGGHSIVGGVMFIIIFVIGHAFNLIINLLGSYVHTSRLQYIEFFSKFYRSGGREFKPLAVRPKHVSIREPGQE